MSGPQGWVWNGTVEVPGHKPVALFVELLAFVNLVEVLCWAGVDDAGDAAWPHTAIGVEVLPRVAVNPRGPLEDLGVRCVASWKEAVQARITERLASLPELIRTSPTGSSS